MEKIIETLLETPKERERWTLWNKTMAQLDGIVDGLGMPIDPGIKETVAALSLNGFPPCSSCEGHIDERFGDILKLCPYVMIEFDEPAERFVDESAIKKSIGEKYGVDPTKIHEDNDAWSAYWEYINTNSVAETEEYTRIHEQNEALQAALLHLLEQFYQGREIPRERRLTVEPIGIAGGFKVTFVTENPIKFQESEIEHYEQVLATEQLEMKQFTHFLKDRFFEKTA